MENLRGELLARGLAPRSATGYARVIRRAEEWCEAHGHDLASVPATVIIEYVHEQPRSWSSRKLLRSGLKHYWEIVGRTDTPAAGIKLPPRPRMVCRALDDREAAILARSAAIRHDDPGMAVLLGLYLALRREEIAGVRWEDFRPGFTELYVVGKRGVSGWVRVHPWLQDRLANWDRRAAWLFPSKRRRQGHVSPATIWEWSRLVAEGAGLPPVPPHVLRHTSLAQANDRTGDLRAVQHFARHADPHVTSGYTRVTQERLNAVVMSLDFMHTAGKRSADRPPPVAATEGRWVA